MWQTVASLERLPAGSKRELANVLAPRVIKQKASEAEIWAFGRLAARALMCGPANAVIEPGIVEPWLQALVDRDWARPAATALAVAQIGRCTGDRARDVSPELRSRIAARLEGLPETKRLARVVREAVALAANEQARVLAESLPIGLRLRDNVAASDSSMLS